MVKNTVVWISALLLLFTALPAFSQEDRKKKPAEAEVKKADKDQEDKKEDKNKEDKKEEKKKEEKKDPGDRLLRYPDIHENKVVFVYGNDLWLAACDDGKARRLTSHSGVEMFPKFSPDGKHIAFSGMYDGNVDVFVIPSDGGEPRRLTYHPSSDTVVGWTNDGAEILFRSSRISPVAGVQRFFTVSTNGGFPKSLPLEEVSTGTFSPDGSRIAYNRYFLETATWKRYKGGLAQDVWIYDLKNNTAEKITDYPGLDFFPMWVGDKIYFVSDRDHFANIYSYELGSKETKKITDQKEFDIKWPSLGPDSIVYEDGGYLAVLDLKTEKSKMLSIKLPFDKAALRPQFRSVANNITNFEISPSGSFALFAARGDIFSIPAGKGNIRNLTDTQGVREQNPIWSPDGKLVAYLSDKTGEYEIYMGAGDGSGKPSQITKGSTSYKFQPLWSPDSSKLLYTDNTRTLYYLDVKKKTPIPIDQGKHVGLMNYVDSKWVGIDSYSWSPDSKWIVYAKTESNSFTSIFLYSVDHGKIFRVTSSFTDDSYPAFDRNGKYLYFVSRRTFLPSFDPFDRTTYTNTRSERIYMALLQKDLTSPFEPELLDKEPVKETKPKAPPSKGKPPAPGKPGLRIDVDGLADRVLALPVSPGNYTDLVAADSKLFYMSRPSSGSLLESGNPMSRSLNCFDLRSKRSVQMMPAVGAFSLAAGGAKIIYSAMGRFGIIPAVPSPFPPGTGALATSRLEMKIDYHAEWKQIFAEAWRLQRDFFYDPGMHGVDWKKMKERYEKLIPHLGSRDDLNYVLGELIGELCCGHTYVFGGDIQSTARTPVGLLGADFEPDLGSGYFRFEKVYYGEKMDPSRQGPLARPGSVVEMGEYLLAINGKPVKIEDNPYKFLENTAGKTVDLTVGKRPSPKGARTIQVRPFSTETALRYSDWVEDNRRKVEKASDGRLGYIHLPDTSIQGLIEFSRGFFSYYRREGLIIDERYNGGGFIPDMFMEHLRRELVCYFNRRSSADMRIPQVSPPTHMACITNAYAGSGGDAFPYYFRKYGLGKLVGTRTWGGLVGIPRTMPLMDGGAVTAPEFGIFDLSGKWVVENHGVDPDIVVDNRPDLVAAGRDPQLEKAIEILVEAIDREPKKEVKRKPFPIRN